ncbi:copper homeostasis protein CutC [uncultured Thomasclavelia sp.]|uniref:copper homeostasis protein CutC n=1 Tax=uncultured Thomasclavelia sp. TaxID=3025759 RepID=UPI0025DB86F3|nr:copper homeostasis protein CutC [uncultured Thomasclavelia sp.]
MSKILEVCCGSYYDAIQAENGGARRIELNSALQMGGLTPSMATLLKVKENTNLEVICMVRPRGAGFCYNEEEFETMKLDAEILLDNGADGIAFGCLTAEGDINIKQTREMVDIIKSYHKTAVFHRAIDCVMDIDESINILITIGVDRILTSGMQEKAYQGRRMIKYLQDAYGKSIEILAGSGINDQNVLDLIKFTGVQQVHSSCKEWLLDPTTHLNNADFGYHGDDYDAVNYELVERLVELVENE